MDPTDTILSAHDVSKYGSFEDGRVVPPGRTRTDDLHSRGHTFEAVTTHDNARVHMGDVHGGQHTHYHGAPPSHPQAKEITLLDALAFEQMDFRSATIASAYARTCNWLFSASAYKRWRNQDLVSEHNGFLWIKGKPGAGKSTLMKHAWEHAQTTYGDENTVSFFFNARGAALGKSVEGMYRCLLHQMVGQVPHLSSKVTVADLSVYRSKGWPIGILQDLFRQAVLQLCRKTRVNCYIDALDEGEDEDEVRGMVEFFYELAERAVSDSLPFCVCLASRYYPKISVSAVEELRLEDHRGHNADISDYVRNKLRLGDEQLKRQLSAEIERRSSGVFLWVVLVIMMLNKEGDRGNQHLLLTRLQEIPDGLLQLIQDVRTRDASDNRFLPAIEWVLYALSPLMPEQLYMAILVSTGALNTESLQWTRQSVDARMIDDFILSSSKGLLEIVDEDSPSTWSDEAEDIFLFARFATPERHFMIRRVQFIHEVVRHYFWSASDFSYGHGITDSEHAKVQTDITQRHCDQLQSVITRDTAPHKSVALRFEESVPSSEQRARESYSINELAVTLGRLECRSAIDLTHHDTGRWTLSFEKTGLFTAQDHHTNFAKLEDEIPANNPAAISHNRLSRICQTYIRIAHANKLALESRTSNETSSALRPSIQHVSFLTYSVQMALVHAELASKNGCHVSDLSQNFPWDEWISYRPTEHAILAANYEDEEFSWSGSSQTAAYAHSADDCHRMDTWLQKMAYEKHPHLVKDELSFIRSNNNQEEVHSLLDACATELGSALHISATRHGSSQCLQLLIDSGANVNQTCENIGSPLHVITRAGNASGVEFLLAHGADVALTDDRGNSALHYAILSKDANVIVALTGGIIPEGKIGEYGDVAQTAGRLNDWMFMRALSDLGARVDALDFSPDGPYTNRHMVLRDFSRGCVPEYYFPALLSSGKAQTWLSLHR